MTQPNSPDQLEVKIRSWGQLVINRPIHNAIFSDAPVGSMVLFRCTTGHLVEGTTELSLVTCRCGQATDILEDTPEILAAYELGGLQAAFLVLAELADLAER